MQSRGSGKTFAAITQVYRLLKHADARRVLFLVDTRNLGEQAEQEFMAFIPNDDNRKFTELYNVQRLKSSSMAGDVQVVISTIQRMYATLKGEELVEGAEEEHPEERQWHRREPLPVVYNAALPPEYFDIVIIDECHRSIYNLWRQVVEYFDAFLIGLTATPDNRTYGFFQKNVVSEYTHEEAVADRVNVGNEIYLIDTEITQSGETIRAEQLVEKRERQTRARRWEVQDEPAVYTAAQLDRSVVNPDQIRTVIRAFHDNWPRIFPGREELPKTLIFAKTDSHADDIIQNVRQEFGEGNDFCRKITNGAKTPKSTLAAFRNEYSPRIAVTVDMIATGTAVRPLECLLFLRDVKSRNYFEQMKGRGTRVLMPDDLKKVTPSASAKTHYVIVDAVGVTKSIKTDSQPLDTKPSVPFKDLAMGLMLGDRTEETVSSLAGRLSRLDNKLGAEDQTKIEQATGKPLSAIVRDLLDAIDADKVEADAIAAGHTEPDDADSSTVRARGEDERELLGLAATVPFDDRYHRNASLDDLSLRLIQQHLQDVGSDLLSQVTELSMEALGRRMNIVGGPSEALFPKNVGLLFFNDHPHEYFPATQIDVVWFPDGPGGDYFEEKEFRGPLAAILRDSVSYIERNFLKEAVVKHPHKPEADRFWNFPIAAIEEALGNAIYHRSYEEREPVEVRITPEELLVLSYPGADRSIRMEDLQRGRAVSRRYRNRRIGEFLKELDLAEGRSTGVPKILRAMRNNGSPAPSFETDEDRTWFRVRLLAHEEFSRVEEWGEAEQHAGQDAVQDNALKNKELASFTEQDTEQVRLLILALTGEMRRLELQDLLRIAHRPHFFETYLNPALDAGLIEMTVPDKPTSGNQRYRRTSAGEALARQLGESG